MNIPDNKRLKKLLAAQKSVEAKYFIFFFGIFLLSWPFIISIGSKPQSFPFYFYFFVWAVILFLLLLASHAGDKDEDNKEND